MTFRRGDDGWTDLAGERVPKDHAMLEALGALDETGAALGLAAALLDQAGEAEAAGCLRKLQRQLIDLGACLAGRTGCDWSSSVAELERLAASCGLSDRPDGFVLQGQSLAGAALHLARTAARRAERRWLAACGQAGPEIAYLNRLSGLLFALALKFEN